MRITMNGRLPRVLGAAIAACLVVAVSYTSAAQAAPDTTALAVGYFKGPNPETVGQKYDLFAPSIRFSSVESGVTAFQEMVGGSLQLAGGIGTPPLALALLKSMPLKVIYVEYTFSQSLVVAPAIKRPQDLVGKTIAVTSGTTGDQSFAEFLKQSGLKPASVKTINMTGPAMIGAFKRGDIAGGYIWDPFQTAMIAAGGHALTTTNPLAAVVASDAIIKSHPDAVQAYVCAIAKANDFILTRHRKTLAEFTALLNGDQETASRVFTTRRFLSPKVVMTEWMGNHAANLAAAIQGVLAWANSKSLTPATTLPDPHRLVDTRFATAAANGACK